jgi:hypothetical protein
MDPQPSNPNAMRLTSPHIAVSRLLVERPDQKAWERITGRNFAKTA